jgi:tetratricopeptide (TPR) repeat protein
MASPLRSAALLAALVGTWSLGADSPLTTEQQADLMMARKMYRDAAELYKQAAPGSPVILTKTGIAYHNLGDLATAAKYYHLAAKADPRYAPAINNLGTVDFARKNYRRAIGSYKKALRLEPRSAPFLANLGTGYLARKDYAHAFATYREALAIDPEILEQRSNLGWTLVDRDIKDRALFHFYLAKTYAQAGSTDRALQNLRKALEEGYKDLAEIRRSSEFAALRNNEEFIRLMTSPPRVL